MVWWYKVWIRQKSLNKIFRFVLDCIQFLNNERIALTFDCILEKSTMKITKKVQLRLQLRELFRFWTKKKVASDRVSKFSNSNVSFSIFFLFISIGMREIRKEWNVQKKKRKLSNVAKFANYSFFNFRLFSFVFYIFSEVFLLF